MLESTRTEPDKPNRNRSVFFIILTVITIVGLIFFYQQVMKMEDEIERQQDEITQTYLQLDSISSELNSRIQRIEELGGEIDTLVAIRTQLEEDKRKLFLDREAQGSQIVELQNRVEGYRELLLIKDKEIQQLQALNEQLAEENTNLKVEKNELNQNIQKLQQDSNELSDKLALASKLQIEGMRIMAVKLSGKEWENEFRNRHIDKLKVEFSVMKNEVAPIGAKDLLLRIVGPDGNVLFDVTKGSGSFAYEGREIFFTERQEILYDKNRQKVTYLYDKGSDYDIGRHQVEVYTDGYLMGKGFFTVK